VLNTGSPMGFPPAPEPNVIPPVLTIGLGIMTFLMGLVAWLFLDWRYALAGFILGSGEAIIGVVWLGLLLGKRNG